MCIICIYTIKSKHIQARIHSMSNKTHGVYPGDSTKDRCRCTRHPFSLLCHQDSPAPLLQMAAEATSTKCIYSTNGGIINEYYLKQMKS